MHPFIQKLAATFFIISLVTALVSCGGGGGGSSDDQIQGKGTVGILLTDKPADPGMFSAIIASIIKIELMPSDENDRFTLFSDGVKEYDLLRLRNESRPLVFKDNVPAGRYCKIRLTLIDLELFLADDTPYDSTDNVTDHPKLPGNGKLDLVARDCFYVAANEVVTLQLDLDMGRSIHIVGNKQGFNFRPVIFVDVVNQDFDSKLVRLNGKIAFTNPDQQTLLLCNALPNQHMDNLGCVNVHFGPDSAFFDSNSPSDGAPRAIKELLSKDKGTELTVVGWASSWNNADYVDDRSAEYYPLLHLEALVAELGKFLTVEGTVAADAVKEGFPMNVSAGGPVITDSTLAVMYQPGTKDINGTRIVSKSGVLLDPLDVKKYLPVQVDGTLQLMGSSDPMLKAALVILDKGALGVKQVTGKILEVYADSLLLNPDVDTVCGVTGPITVGLSNDLEILTVTITDANSEIAPGGMLEDGQTVNMNGTCEGTNYQTDNIVGIIE
jgi:hypothetical protein